jgi:hypothetical protein
MPSEHAIRISIFLSAWLAYFLAWVIFRSLAWNATDFSRTKANAKPHRLRAVVWFGAILAAGVLAAIVSRRPVGLSDFCNVNESGYCLHFDGRCLDFAQLLLVPILAAILAAGWVRLLIARRFLAQDKHPLFMFKRCLLLESFFAALFLIWLEVDDFFCRVFYSRQCRCDCDQLKYFFHPDRGLLVCHPSEALYFPLFEILANAGVLLALISLPVIYYRAASLLGGPATGQLRKWIMRLVPLGVLAAVFGVLVLLCIRLFPFLFR